MPDPTRGNLAGHVDETPKLAGQAVLDSRWAFERVLGEDLVRAALAGLPTDVRETYEGTTSVSWVPYEVMRQVHDAYGKSAGEPVEALLEKVIPMAIERSFSTVWRIFLRFTSDAAIISRTPLLNSRTRSRGTMTAEVVGPGHGVVQLRDWASIPRRDVHALGISIASFLRVAGREDVTASGDKTATGARWDVRWRA